MKKKILIANSHIPWGGLGQYTINLSQNLSDKGYEVYGLITHQDDQLFRVFSQTTKETYYVGDYSRIRKYAEIIKIILKLKPHIIIENYLAPIHFVSCFIPKFTKIISIIHSDANDYYRIAALNKNRINSWIVPTLKLKNEFEKYVGDSKITDKIVVIPHGVKMDITPKNIKRNTCINILFIGSLFEHKGVDLLPEIMNEVKNRCADVHLTIIGDGVLKEYLNEKILEYNLSSYISLIGVITNSQVRKYLQNADILLFPTRLEAFGLVIAESMMEGVVPIVSLLHDVTDQIVENDVTGYLVPVNDVKGFVDKIEVLYHNPQKKHTMSLLAKKHAEKYFTSEIMINQYIEVIEKIL